MLSPLFLCVFTADQAIAQQLRQQLGDDRFHLHIFQSCTELEETVHHQSERIDCLIIDYDAQVLPLFNAWYEQTNLLPAVLITDNALPSNNSATYYYHNAETCLPRSDLDQIETKIDQAIARFLSLASSCLLGSDDDAPSPLQSIETQSNPLLIQQRRLAEKLNERLGYLGVYYKRNPQYFYRNFTPEVKAKLKDQLLEDYREIILNYFQESSINDEIDQFVNRVFFADLSISQILEIHMELMDQFAKQLKVEGRSDDILLDYRLTLIDILAHLGEMYRRSIPRENIL